LAAAKGGAGVASGVGNAQGPSFKIKRVKQLLNFFKS
jgi:hypothetical protein